MIDAATVLEQHGLRCTRQRVEVLTALASATSHPTAEELHRIVNARGPGRRGGVSLATVYNTLEALCRAGAVRRIAGGPGGWRYDATVRDHVHLTTPAGEVMDVPEDLGKELIARVEPRLLAEVERRMGVRRVRAVISLVGEG